MKHSFIDGVGCFIREDARGEAGYDYMNTSFVRGL